MLVKSRKLSAMPVVSLSDGRNLGRVRALVIDPGSLRLAALALEAGGFLKERRFIPFEAVKSIGEDAVTIEDSGSVVRLSTSPDLASLVRQPVSLLGCHLITEDGRFLGTASEYLFSLDGKIDHFEVDCGWKLSLTKGKATLSAEVVRTVGQGSIIVNSEAPSLLSWSGSRLEEVGQGVCRFLGRFNPHRTPPADNPPPSIGN